MPKAMIAGNRYDIVTPWSCPRPMSWRTLVPGDETIGGRNVWVAESSNLRGVKTVENDGHLARWVWHIWLTAIGLLIIGIVLWLLRLAADREAGPVIAGVFVDGPAQVTVLVIYAFTAGVLATISTALVSRTTHNPLGWVLWWMAMWTVATFFTTMALFAAGPNGSWTWQMSNWLGEWTFALAVPSSIALLLFPSGEFLSPKWRLLAWLAVAGTLGWALTEATGAGLGLEQEIPNPLANATLESVGQALSILLLVALAGTGCSLLIRYRSASHIVRLQVKWVLVGGLLQVAAIAMTSALDAASTSDFPVVGAIVGLLSTLAVPLSLVIAILRYRLYSIDHLISRTASYALLASLFGAIFVLGVVGAQSLLGLSNSLSVALATLALASLFNPVRRRLNRAMDRRFNRSRFDLDNESEEFGRRTASTLSMQEVLEDLEATVRRTMAPETMGVWVRD
jgi:hypothetical protein